MSVATPRHAGIPKSTGPHLSLFGPTAARDNSSRCSSYGDAKERNAAAPEPDRSFFRDVIGLVKRPISSDRRDVTRAPRCVGSVGFRSPCRRNQCRLVLVRLSYTNRPMRSRARTNRAHSCSVFRSFSSCRIRRLSRLHPRERSAYRTEDKDHSRLQQPSLYCPVSCLYAYNSF